MSQTIVEEIMFQSMCHTLARVSASPQTTVVSAQTTVYGALKSWVPSSYTFLVSRWLIRQLLLSLCLVDVFHGRDAFSPPNLSAVMVKSILPPATQSVCKDKLEVDRQTEVALPFRQC